ncbi:MAG: SpoIIE family protein phosphatase [Kofleriaceae bacterium]|nr:SpoIIE family protein phosphatase [Kofleriaceae bacterium]
MPSLVFLTGPIAGRRYRLSEGEHVIGRRSDCQIFVPDMRVSRQHARLSKNERGWTLEDLGSNNGTFVNGVRVQSSAVVDTNDEITIASNRIRVEAHEPSPPAPDGNAVTLVDVGTTPLIHSRVDADDTRPFSSGVDNGLDPREVRLLERKLDALSQVLHATAASDNVEALLQKIAEALLELFPQADDVGVLVDDDRTGELRVRCQRHRLAAPEDGAPTQAAGNCALRVPRTIIQHVISDRRGVLLGDRRHGDESAGLRMGAPLTYHGSHYGVVYVESHAVGFRQDDVDLLQAIATQAGLALHAAHIATELARREQLERDLRVARQIQRSLLPAGAPQIHGLDFAVHYEPAYEIGGDFYDFIWHDPTHLGIAVGDVSGKAISAALYMARVTSELRSRAAIARTPSRLLRRVNRAIAELGDDGMFATLAYCIYDLEHRSLVFTNAGHCTPLLRRKGQVFPLHADQAHAPPLGVTPELDASEARIQLEPGDLLVLVSDGILEARNAAGDEYGLPRLAERMRSTVGTARSIVDAILIDVDHHAQDQRDDMTIVAMAIDDRRARRASEAAYGP